MDQQAEKDKTERVTGLGRRTREERAKWKQMTALRFKTEGRHQTSPASLRGAAKGIPQGDNKFVLYCTTIRHCRKTAVQNIQLLWE